MRARERERERKGGETVGYLENVWGQCLRSG